MEKQEFKKIPNFWFELLILLGKLEEIALTTEC